MPVPDLAFQLVGVRKSYNAVQVLSGLDLRVAPGEFVSLVGPSGCGKTTTLNIVAGFVEPDAGEVRIRGRSMAGVEPHRRDLGMVFQNHALFPHKTVAENVAFGLRMRGVPSAEIKQRMGEALELVRLTGFESRFPRELSGGQQQRVGMARALVVRPHVILMDEPLSSLDAKLRREMQIELRSIQRRVGITALYVTHDQEEALSLSDRVVVMNGGRIEQIGTPEDVYARPATEFVAGFIGEANFLDAVVMAVRGPHAEIELATGAKVLIAASGTLQSRDSIRVAIRPERIALASWTVSQHEASLKGTVVSQAFFGPTRRYVVDLGAGRPLVADVPVESARDWNPGAIVAVAIAPQDWLIVSSGRAAP